MTLIREEEKEEWYLH